jgi:hypothetical protein
LPLYLLLRFDIMGASKSSPVQSQGRLFRAASKKVRVFNEPIPASSRFGRLIIAGKLEAATPFAVPIFPLAAGKVANPLLADV